MPRGISTRGDILATTIDGVSLDSIWQEFSDTLSIWNTERSAVANLFTQPTIQSGTSVSQAAESDPFELASAFGVPQSRRAEVEPLVLGFPLNWYDTATRYTEEFIRDATADQVRAQHDAALGADNLTIFRDVLKALFQNTNRANDEGATVYPLWNNDGMNPPPFAGKTFASSHSHYLVSGAATIDGGDLRDLTNTITEHGYGLNGNWGVVILANPAESDLIRGFRANPASPTTAPFDFIPAQDAPAYISDENIIGDRPAGKYNGLTVIGSYGRALIIEDYHVPVGYLAATATDVKPLAFREHTRPEYRGLRIKRGDAPTHPIVGSIYARGFGVGVQHRGAAAVMKIAASGSYTPPAL